ncbi:hypothetical protein V8C86DRAFT_1473185 [Haematococcus lacustris]
MATHKHRSLLLQHTRNVAAAAAAAVAGQLQFLQSNCTTVPNSYMPIPIPCCSNSGTKGWCRRAEQAAAYLRSAPNVSSAPAWSAEACVTRLDGLFMWQVAQAHRTWQNWLPGCLAKQTQAHQDLLHGGLLCLVPATGPWWLCFAVSSRPSSCGPSLSPQPLPSASPQQHTPPAALTTIAATRRHSLMHAPAARQTGRHSQQSQSWSPALPQYRAG